MKKTQLYKLLQNDKFDVKPNSYGDLLFIDKFNNYPYVQNNNIKCKTIKTLWELYSLIKYDKTSIYLKFRDMINSNYLICDNIIYRIQIFNGTNEKIIPIEKRLLESYNNVVVSSIKIKWSEPRSNKKIKEVENILKMDYINTL